MSYVSELIVEAIGTAFEYKLRTASKIEAGHHFLRHACNDPHSLDALRTRLGDDKSRKLLDWIIVHRAITAITSREIAEQLSPPRIGQSKWDSLILEAKRLPEYNLEENLDIDVVENYILDGYNLKGVCEVEPGDIVFDLGAFNGNSAIVLGRRAGPKGKVYAFEPNPSTQQVFNRNIESMGIQNAILVPKGVSNKEERLRFMQSGAASRIDPNGDVEVHITTIDNFVRENNLSDVNFIKFDIEGYERGNYPGSAGLGGSIAV